MMTSDKSRSKSLLGLGANAGKVREQAARKPEAAAGQI